MWIPLISFLASVLACVLASFFTACSISFIAFLNSFKRFLVGVGKLPLGILSIFFIASLKSPLAFKMALFKCNFKASLLPKYGIKGFIFSTMKLALIVSALFSGSLVTPWLIVFGLITLSPKEFKISLVLFKIDCLLKIWLFSSLANSLPKSKLFKLLFKALKSTTPLTLFLSIRFLIILASATALSLAPNEPKKSFRVTPLMLSLLFSIALRASMLVFPSRLIWFIRLLSLIFFIFA
ncbi:hypothetical protein CAHY103746_08325 [Campylobacter hyointestinalis subsp. hyointestinalis]